MIFKELSQEKSFWLTNISNRNISLADLNLTIKAFSSINLLDNKHYQYNLKQLEKSEQQGSIFKKRNRLKVRKVAPEILKMNVPFIKETYIPSRERSVLEIKEEEYEELAISDEQFAKDNADIIQLDEKPLTVRR